MNMTWFMQGYQGGFMMRFEAPVTFTPTSGSDWPAARRWESKQCLNIPLKFFIQLSVTVTFRVHNQDMHIFKLLSHLVCSITQPLWCPSKHPIVSLKSPLIHLSRTNDTDRGCTAQTNPKTRSTSTFLNFRLKRHCWSRHVKVAVIVTKTNLCHKTASHHVFVCACLCVLVFVCHVTWISKQENNPVPSSKKDSAAKKQAAANACLKKINHSQLKEL